MLTEIEYAPLRAFQKLHHLPHAAFLDSARFHPLHGRYSLLAADPKLIVCATGAQTTVSAKRGRVTVGGDPWEVLDAMLSRFRHNHFNPKQPLPVGAAIGFLSYDLGRWLEKLPTPRPALLPTPDLWFGFYDVVFVFDHLEQRGWLISSGLDESGVQNAAQAEFRRDQFLDELQSDVAIFPPQKTHPATIQPTWDAVSYRRAVTQALDYIRRGDIYQVNLAQSFFGTVDEAPHETYLRLRASNPAPFGAFLNYGEGQLLSSSPERFLHMERRSIQTRPIKGTCARTGNPDIDWAEAETLLQSTKNRAELLMITDLLRNDLGRVAEFGSVQVPKLVTLEEYETVYHLVSTVEANLRQHILHLDALAACFPGGSITGAPKLRAMEIIHELEPVGRGVYTGALGYIGFNGISDFNILIRSLIHQDGQVCFHAGGGIVADSEPELEYEETLHKARGILNLWSPATPPQIVRTDASI
jgi:para-aminobenzoate synthetase component I